MSSIANLQKSVEICEERIQRCRARQSDEDENEEYWVYPPAAQCLYHQMLGDAYLKIFQELETQDGARQTERETYAHKCLNILETGMELAGSTLQIVDRKLF